MKNFKEFLKQFKFDPSKKLLIGVERECHFKDKAGNIVPLAEKVLNYLEGLEGYEDGHFGYELSACQLEWRIGPCSLSELKRKMLKDEIVLKKIEEKLGFSRSFEEVAPENMPLDVYPDPTGRYQRIVKNLPPHVLLAACRVIATHIHVGMPDYHTALKVYNSVIPHLSDLCKLGDHSNGKRLEIYKIMAPNFLPPFYKNWEEFYELSIREKFTDDPRSCWHLIRISVHGTIEFRMFGATENIEEIVNWAKICYKICKISLENK